MKLDITMTAALRPEILSRTLFSLKKSMKWVAPFRLIVDIAPVGESGYTQRDMVSIIKHYFPDNLIRIQDESLQAGAIKWAWSQVSSSFFLHWKDDWVLRQDVSIVPMVQFMQQLSTVGMIYFDRYKKSVLSYPNYQGKFQYIHSGFWKRIAERSLAGPPALLRTVYAQGIAQQMDINTCLDIESRKPWGERYLDDWHTYVYTDHAGGLVEDIGKVWKEQQGLIMTKRTTRGVTWSKK